MKKRTLKTLLVFLCIVLLFSGCRARIIGNRTAAKETTLDPGITSEQYTPEPETTTEPQETTEEENKEVIILDKTKVNSTAAQSVYRKGAAPAHNYRPRTVRHNRNMRPAKPKTTVKKTKQTTTAPNKTTTTTTTKPSAPTAATYYKVSFDSNGGWGKTKTRKVAFNQTYGEEFPKVYNKKGYTFLGWFDAKSGGHLVKNTDRFKFKKDITLFAHWNYDASTFWRNYLISANLYPCQIQRIYIEYDEDNKTVRNSEFINLTRSENAAQDSESESLSDQQIKALGCDMIIKVVSDYENAPTYYNKMKNRFSYKPVYVLPKAAEFGTKDEKTYYALLLSEKIYEKGFTDFDREKCEKELKIKGSVYTKD